MYEWVNPRILDLVTWCDCPVGWDFARGWVPATKLNSSVVKMAGLGQLEISILFYPVLSCFSYVFMQQSSCKHSPQHTLSWQSWLHHAGTFAVLLLEAPLQPLEQNTRLHGWAGLCCGGLWTALKLLNIVERLENKGQMTFNDVQPRTRHFSEAFF